MKNEKLALFIGAGVSRLMNIPLWDELAFLIIDYLRNANYLNHSESERIKIKNFSAKQVVSIFHRIVRDQKIIDKFYKENIVAKDFKKNPYSLLSEFEDAIGSSLAKVSTNIDLEWENVLVQKQKKQEIEISKSGKSNASQITYSKTQSSGFSYDQIINPSILYQIHGSLNDLSNAVLTTSQYITHYRDYKGLKGFPDKVFKEYTVLFIGSGIQEFEILEHCLKESKLHHYALIDTNLGEANLFRIQKAYFDEVNIQAIPYYLDFHHYKRLIYILESWISEIKSSKRKGFYYGIKKIDEVLKDVG